jgi:hypothetical protein
MVTHTDMVGLFHEPVRLRLRALVVMVLVCGGLYGAVMGSFSGLDGRPLQMLVSATKVPLLVLATFGLSLPSFFVLNTIAGVASDFHDALKAHVQTQAATCLLLVSVAPVTGFWYASGSGYNGAIAFNAMLFGVASVAGQLVLRRLYRPLVERNRVHRVMLGAWLVLYSFVGIQMAWVLRPFVGAPDRPTQFFREGAWGNAYVELFGILRKAVGGD